MPKKKRNYRKEYDNYQGKKKQKKRRAARNSSRAAMKKSSNLKVTSKAKNRSFKRTKNARKKA